MAHKLNAAQHACMVGIEVPMNEKPRHDFNTPVTQPGQSCRLICDGSLVQIQPGVPITVGGNLELIS